MRGMVEIHEPPWWERIKASKVGGGDNPPPPCDDDVHRHWWDDAFVRRIFLMGVCAGIMVHALANMLGVALASWFAS